MSNVHVCAVKFARCLRLSLCTEALYSRCQFGLKSGGGNGDGGDCAGDNGGDVRWSFRRQRQSHMLAKVRPCRMPYSRRDMQEFCKVKT